MARTRSAAAHRKILDAAAALVAERGVDGASMDSIAELAGVSKATIYKHWTDKEALILEMLADLHGVHDRPAFDSGDTRADIISALTYRAAGNEAMREKILPHLVAYSFRNKEFGIAWRKIVMQPPIRELTRLIQGAVSKGELRPAPSMDLSLSLLLGPMIYWKVYLEKTTGNPTKLAHGVVDAYWQAFGR